MILQVNTSAGWKNVHVQGNDSLDWAQATKYGFMADIHWEEHVPAYVALKQLSRTEGIAELRAGEQAAVAQFRVVLGESPNIDEDGVFTARLFCKPA